MQAETRRSDLPSFSKLDRAFACPASEVLQHRPKKEDTKYSGPGTLKHELIASALLGDESEEVVIDGVDYSPLRDRLTGDLIVEGCFTWNIVAKKGRSLGTHHRAYDSISDHESPGTLDYVCVREDEVEVIDLKTGYVWVSPKTWQLKAAACVLASVYPGRLITTTIAQPNRDGVLEFRSISYDALGIALLEGEFGANWSVFLEGAATASEHLKRNSHPSVTHGKHCTYCPARLDCPAHQLAVPGGFALDGMTIIEVFERIQKAKALIKDAESWTHEYVSRNGGVVVDGERTLRLSARNRRVIVDNENALAAIPEEELDVVAPRKILLSKLSDETAEKVEPFIETRESLVLKISN